MLLLSVPVTLLTRLQAGFSTADHAGKLYQTIVCTAFDLLGLERLTMKNDAVMAPNIRMLENCKLGATMIPQAVRNITDSKIT